MSEVRIWYCSYSRPWWDDMQTKEMAENYDYDIYLDGCKLHSVHEAKFLGIAIDDNFTWKKQVENVYKLCLRNIGALKVKSFLPTNAMYKLYCSLVLPYLNYGLLLWGNANKCYINIFISTKNFIL